MAYEFLKKLFGTPKEGEQPKAMTYAELEAAIDADKGISVVNLKDGGYVSKDKFDAKDTELKGVQAQLTAANQQIKSFEGMDVEGIKQKTAEWETKYNTDTQQLKDQLAAMERSHAEEMFLSGYQFTSKAARNGILAELRTKGFKIDGGELVGGKEFIQSLMDSDDYKGAFVPSPTDDNNAGNTQPQPRFAGGTGGNQDGNKGGDAPMFNFGFSRLRQPTE